MEMPSASSSTERLLEFGDFHLAKLRGDSRAATIAGEFEPRMNALRASSEGKRAAREAVDAAEAQLFVAEEEVENIIRRIAGILGAAVKRDTKRSPYIDVFPANLEGALMPRSAAQAMEARRIIGAIARLGTTAAASIPPETATVVAQLSEATGALDTKVAAYETASTAAGAAAESELGERRRFREQYRKSFGLLTSVYPDDRKKVEGYFKKDNSRPKKKAPPAGPPAA